MEKVKIIATGDGSKSVFVPHLEEAYHSTHGALTESIHVYINMGLKYAAERFGKNELRVFELGFGTGLNALLTAFHARKWKLSVQYTSVEKYPLPVSVIRELGFTNIPPLNEMTEEAEAIIQADWDVPLEVNPSFILEKKELDFFDYRPSSLLFDLIYFDAFGYRAQSELWGESAFSLCAKALVQGGILVTYASKGSARRAMMASGFEVEKLPGAPGKREMIRAYRK